jgi:hypothetical protein
MAKNPVNKQIKQFRSRNQSVEHRLKFALKAILRHILVV